MGCLDSGEIERYAEDTSRDGIGIVSGDRNVRPGSTSGVRWALVDPPAN